MNYSTMKSKGFASRAEAWGLAVLFTVILVVAQGMEVKGQQVASVDQKSNQLNASEKEAFYELLFGTNTTYFITSQPPCIKKGKGDVKVIDIESAALIGELSNEDHEEYLVEAELIVIRVGTNEQVGNFSNGLFNNVPKLKYVHLVFPHGTNITSNSIPSSLGVGQSWSIVYTLPE